MGEVSATLAIAAAVALACVAALSAALCRVAAKVVALSEEARSLSPHARVLGREVWARVYAGSDWERMVVVAVSWHGAVCVRPASDMRASGRWIAKDLVPERVSLSEGRPS